MQKIIQRGAEAILYLDKSDGETALVKERVKKSYRLPELDEKIRKQRTARESSLLSAARRSSVSTPRIIDVKGFSIIMEFIDGQRVKDVFNSLPEKERGMVCRLIGEMAAKMHAANIVHGDLTTSNMILKDGKLFIIDFSLGKNSNRPEDKATDLYLLYEAIKAIHYKCLDSAWRNILNTYEHNYSNSADVLRQLEKIEKRRRYK